ncbi:pilus assembly protein [Hydrogenophaga luteola]|uniref:Pilus assembly protein n=1 Tax=Hydrogenophaga luteola TaxID=1591122 RepID=A0ABV7WAK1_9BURK
MNTSPVTRRLPDRALFGLLSCVAVLAASSALAQPSQKPLLTTVSGAKPNLMVVLDNSGSMGYSYHETYGVLADTDASTTIRRCVPGGSGYPAYGLALGGRPTNTPQAQTAGTSRICLTWGGTSWVWQAGSNYPTPRQVVGSWSAQRSPQVNPVYYNPNITYRLRVDASGNNITPPDAFQFVSNQGSIHTAYEYRSDSLYYHSSLSTGDNAYYSIRTGTEPTGAPAYGLYAAFRIPKHITYTSATAATPGFTSVRCNDVMTNPESGLQDGCRQFTTTTITFAGNATTSDTTCVVGGVCTTTGTVTRTYIDLPTGHARTDCNVSGNTNRCSVAQETENVKNWYRYYFNRQEAATSAIGQALANPDLEGEIRVGYMLINRKNGSVMDLVPGVNTTNTDTLRGVRMLDSGSTDNQELYNWLYSQVPRGGTPLHNAVDKVAQYYRADTTGVRENPWSTNPADLANATSNPEMSCRRSFNLLFSDGAWTRTLSTNSGDDHDNEDGDEPGFDRLRADGTTEYFRYLRRGINTTLGRKQYTPYPATATGGLADLTAEYFWHTDLRESLENGVTTRAGQPTFWQNMTTYTVGYQIAPSSPLTFDQITQYQSEYAQNGYTAATKPSWPTGDLTSSSVADTLRVNDFLQAGYTGGGRGFSARSADDVRNIFDTVLSDILNSSGNDAGVAVSGSTTGAATSTIQDRVKYSVSYRTIDNTGDIEAQELAADGSVSEVLWTASTMMPTYDERNVYSISNDNTPFEFTGTFTSLPDDIEAALKTGPDSGRIANDTSFVDYLRGKDPVNDVDNVLFRQRATPIAAMVNPPSIYMGGNQDLIYDLVGNVEGSSDYQVYMQKRRSFPASLYVATNGGVLHALSASTGVELAGFMPRRSMRRLLDYAKVDYDFQYILDGPISENDLYIRNPVDDTTLGWQHMAVGTGGRGEQLVYAVTAPLKGDTADNTADRTPEMGDFAWETGPDKINNGELTMGYITTPAIGGQTENGSWVVILPSGHYNGVANNRKHGLIVLDASTGELLRNIPLPGAADAGRGLGAVTLMRKEKRIVGAYAGDAKGNLWRFDLRGAPADWRVSYGGEPVFRTVGERPIYGAPAWQEHPEGGNIVVFATGMLLDDDDIGDTAEREAIYGIWDPTPVGADDVSFTTRQAANLVSQTIDQSSRTTSGLGDYFTISNNEVDWTTDHGWTVELGYLDEGERNIDRVQNFGASIFLSTVAIAESDDEDEEICKISDLPVNYLYVLDALTGSLARNGTSFDVLDDDDNSGTDGKGDGFVVGRIESGGFSRAVVLPPTFETPTEPPTETECKGNCDGYVDKDLRRYLDGGSSLGEDTPDPPCGAIGTRAIGANPLGGPPIEDNCPTSKAWSRTQIQLSAPPSN